jgi:hypothetical protein
MLHIVRALTLFATVSLKSYLGSSIQPTKSQKVIFSYGPSRDAFVLSFSTAKKIFKLGGPINPVIFDHELQRPTNLFGDAFFDHRTSSPLTISSVPLVWLENSQGSQPETQSVQHNIIAVLPSTSNSQLVLVDAVGNYSVWDMQTSGLIERYTETHAQDQRRPRLRKAPPPPGALTV